MKVELNINQKDINDLLMYHGWLTNQGQFDASANIFHKVVLQILNELLIEKRKAQKNVKK